MAEDILEHYGVKRRSGRYPWGSGEKYRKSVDFLSQVDDMKAQGMSQKDIAKALDMSTTEYRSRITIANSDRKKAGIAAMQSLVDKGYSNVKISDTLGISEATVRNWRANKKSIQEQQIEVTSDRLRDAVKDFEYVEVGKGVEYQLGVTRQKLNAAIEQLKDEGYYTHEVYIKRLNDNSGNTVTMKILTKEPDLEVVKANSDKINTPEPVNKGKTDVGAQGLKPINYMSWDKVDIRYDEDGGTNKDGVIELRRGAEGLDLGNAKYAQVRIGVGGTHYLKGMAIYSDDLPKGVDVRFNTNKSKNTPKEKVLKELKKRSDGSINEDNPFGTSIKQNGQRGHLNIVNEEGDWDKWSSTLSAQFLSKQPTSLIKERLGVTLNDIRKEYDELQSITNPVVKKHLMDKFETQLQNKARMLKAKGMPNTKGHVILPFNSIKPNEVYAPNYTDGDRLVLVRYPHGGRFELPELVVNNKNKSAKKTIGNALDALGIHPSVASKLSGADFDGDTVYAIPNNSGKVKTARSLKELKNFDPNMYKVDRVTISPAYKQKQMGIVSNLITDMTIKGATPGELARAVRHSMVVIDSEKHKLDWKKSAEDNGIKALQKKYQTFISQIDNKQHTAASTLISRSKQDVREGGEFVKYVDKATGKTKRQLVGADKVSIIDYVGDARKLSSGTAVENLYADYINNVKAIQNNVRKDSAKLTPIQRDPQAAKKYASEVKSLDSKLQTALANAPRERAAQLMATSTYYKNLNYDMTNDDKKKLKSQALAAARVKVGSQRSLVDVTPKEWEAIQKGAISNHKLEQILNNADLSVIRKYATPRSTTGLAPGKVSRAKMLLDKGYTYAQVADSLGVSATTIRKAITES